MLCSPGLMSYLSRVKFDPQTITAADACASIKQGLSPESADAVYLQVDSAAGQITLSFPGYLPAVWELRSLAEHIKTVPGLIPGQNQVAAGTVRVKG